MIIENVIFFCLEMRMNNDGTEYNRTEPPTTLLKRGSGTGVFM